MYNNCQQCVIDAYHINDISHLNSANWAIQLFKLSYVQFQQYCESKSVRIYMAMSRQVLKFTDPRGWIFLSGTADKSEFLLVHTVCWQDISKTNYLWNFIKTVLMILELRLKVWPWRAEPDKMSLTCLTVAKVHSLAFTLMPLLGQSLNVLPH